MSKDVLSSRPIIEWMYQLPIYVASRPDAPLSAVERRSSASRPSQRAPVRRRATRLLRRSTPFQRARCTGDRLNQTDFRAGKVLRFGDTRTIVSVDLYNVFNSDAILTENSNFAV